MNDSRFDRLTRHLGRRTSRRTAVGTSLGAFALGALDYVAAGRQATPAPGATPAAESEPSDFLFVQTAASGRGEINPGAGTPEVGGRPAPAGGASFLLTLEGHTGQTIYFSDRPDRVVGASPTPEFLKGLGFGVENPPNAALVAEFKSGQGVVVFELIEPTWDPESGTLVYGAEVLEGFEGERLAPVLDDQIAERLPAEFSAAALFIDACADMTTCWCSDVYNLGVIPVGPVAMVWDFWSLHCLVKSADEYQTAIDSCWQAYGGEYCTEAAFIKLGRSDMVLYDPYFAQ
jgi:hypothetical protein